MTLNNSREATPSKNGDDLISNPKCPKIYELGFRGKRNHGYDDEVSESVRVEGRF